MASLKRSKMSLFAQSAYLTPNTVGGGQAYQVRGDGSWTPLEDHLAADEQLEDAEAPLSSAVSSITKSYEGTYSRFLRTHSEELWWRFCMGTAVDATVPSDPQTIPPTWSKTYHSVQDGPSGAYTIVQDRSAYGTGPDNLYQSVYSGCKVRSWSVGVTIDQPVMVSADYIAERVVTTGGAQINPAPYERASVGKPAAFGWHQCRVRIGNEGQVGSHQIGYLKYLRYRQDNKLNTDRRYIDGTTNMEDPDAENVPSGQMSMEFDYAAQVDTEIIDRFERSQVLSVELTMTRPPYSARFWWPSVHIARPQITGPKSGGVGTVTSTGMLTWDHTTPDRAVTLTLVTEGSQP